MRSLRKLWGEWENFKSPKGEEHKKKLLITNGRGNVLLRDEVLLVLVGQVGCEKSIVILIFNDKWDKGECEIYNGSPQRLLGKDVWKKLLEWIENVVRRKLSEEQDMMVSEECDI